MFQRVRKMFGRDERNRELPSPVPIAPPVGWFKQPSMFDQVRDMVRSEHLRMYAASQGAETFEEASDFDVEDDMFPASQYEDPADFEPLADLQARRQAEFEREFLAKRDRMKRKREEAELAQAEAAEAALAAGLSPAGGSSGARPEPAKGEGKGGSAA